MKKSIIIFVTATVLSASMIVYGWTFLDSRIGEAVLTEETLMGDRAAVDGLTVGFSAESAENLHWVNSFDYGTDKTESSFRRGEATSGVEKLGYDDIRFTGCSVTPYFTRLNYSRLEGLQQKGIHSYYDRLQQKVTETGMPETGKIKLKDYLDFYPVSFQFRFGTQKYNSDNALTGLKVYDERSILSAETGTSYDEDVDLYVAFNKLFKIPVIENEYQEYKVSKLEKYDRETSLGYKTEIEKPLGEGEDYYEFNPIIVLQEENVMDGKKWYHQDLSGGLSYEAGGESAESYVGKTADQYNLKNRMLITVNNRTAKGAPVDLSQIEGGYGVYELPFEVMATATVGNSRRSRTIVNPVPLTDQMKMVYPLDDSAEYVEMSLSGDHRYLAVFLAKGGAYFVDMVDADTWTSAGPIKLFPASEKMTFAWGADGSLAVTNYEGYVAVLSQTSDESRPYEIIYSGETPDGFDKAFFDTGLAIATKDGKAALVQNLLMSDAESNIRNAALECAVIDKNGVIYRGILKSNIVDLEYDMSADEIRAVRSLLDDAADGEGDSELSKHLIEPVRSENWAKWQNAN